MEIWPSLDLMDGKVVRLVRGDPRNMIIYSEDPLKTARDWEEAEVDGLHVVDLDAALGIGNNLYIIKKLAEKVHLPLQFGGGLHSLDDVDKAFKIGVDRVIVSTALLTGKIDALELLRYGANRVVVALDHVCGRIVVDGWRQKLHLELDPTLRAFWDTGYRIFLSTNVGRDGTLTGLDVALLESIRQFLNSMYFAGGIASLRDLEMLKINNVRGVVLGRVLYDKVIRIEEALEVARSGSS
ncbi:MAG: 1-(5-phosphoribosyl)-5-[(5-phosphoribosylamino)methylideneamino]imidazole-4-carboxamide isomerase [Nitrososphaeria archaeon]